MSSHAEALQNDLNKCGIPNWESKIEGENVDEGNITG